MKKTLLLSIYTFIFCFCKGQEVEKRDSAYLKYWVDSAGAIPPNVDLSSLHLITGEAGVYMDTVSFKENDTVQVVMLLCDTAPRFSQWENTDGTRDTIGNPIYVPYVKWKYGYKVYDYTNEEIVYLDEQKNKLNKNIIVWQDLEK